MVGGHQNVKNCIKEMVTAWGRLRSIDLDPASGYPVAFAAHLLPKSLEPIQYLTFQ